MGRLKRTEIIFGQLESIRKWLKDHPYPANQGQRQWGWQKRDWWRTYETAFPTLSKRELYLFWRNFSGEA